MTKRETHRLQEIERYQSGQLQQVRAAKLLGISSRHLRRLIKKYKAQGAQGLVSGHRGKPSNHQLAANLKARALDLVKSNYADFGPPWLKNT